MSIELVAVSLLASAVAWQTEASLVVWARPVGTCERSPVASIRNEFLDFVLMLIVFLRSFFLVEVLLAIPILMILVWGLLVWFSRLLGLRPLLLVDVLCRWYREQVHGVLP